VDRELKDIVDPRMDKARALLNDPQGIIANDKALVPFVDIAQALVPVIAAALFAQSKGAYEEDQ
jgi:hypothetical protein